MSRRQPAIITSSCYRTAIMLTRISYPPESASTPRRAIRSSSFVVNHFQDHSGRSALSIWMQSRPSPPPLYSFQVYITYELSPTQTLGLEALAKEVFRTILAGDNRMYKRLDLNFMRPGEGAAAFIESHQSLVQAKHADFAKVVVPSYACPGFWGYSAFLFVVSGSDWKQAGLKSLLFEPDARNRRALAEPVSEKVRKEEDIEEIVREVYNSWELKEAYEELFSEGQQAGMTEWQEILDAAGKLGMILV